MNMKKFVVDFGRGLIDFSAWIVLIVIVLTGIFLFGTEPVGGFLTIFLGLILFVAFYYLIYLFVDIRDLLKEIVEQNRYKNNQNDTENEIEE